jgi:hypothetical protein
MSCRRRRVAALPASLLFAIGAGCFSPGNDRSLVQRADSAGITIVANAAADRALDWSFTEVRRLGGREEGPESFYQLHEWTVDTDAGGRIYVLDLSRARVVVFDSAGTPLRSFGGKGSGPGEIEEPIAMAVGDDGHVVVADAGRMVAVSWDSAGHLADVTESVHPLPLTHKTIEIAGGELLTIEEQPEASGDTVVWRLLGRRGTIAAVRLPRGRPVNIGCAMGDFAPLFAPDVVWDVGRDRVAYAEGTSYQLEVLTEGARARLRLRRNIEPREVTASLAAREAESGIIRLGPYRMKCTSPAAMRVEKQGYWPLLPAVADLEVAPDGSLWVERTRVHGEPQQVDVFDADGVYLGTLPPESPFPVAFLPDGRFLALRRDEMDLDRIVIYRVNTP